MIALQFTDRPAQRYQVSLPLRLAGCAIALMLCAAGTSAEQPSQIQLSSAAAATIRPAWALLARQRPDSPEPVPAPASNGQAAFRFAPIGQISLDTATSQGLSPPDQSARLFGSQPPVVLAPGDARDWPPQMMVWYGVRLHYAPVHPLQADETPNAGHLTAPASMPHRLGELVDRAAEAAQATLRAVPRQAR
jgi:hypothetical protein